MAVRLARLTSVQRLRLLWRLSAGPGCVTFTKKQPDGIPEAPSSTWLYTLVGYAISTLVGYARGRIIISSGLCETSYILCKICVSGSFDEFRLNLYRYIYIARPSIWPPLGDHIVFSVRIPWPSYVYIPPRRRGYRDEVGHGNTKCQRVPVCVSSRNRQNVLVMHANKPRPHLLGESSDNYSASSREHIAFTARAVLLQCSTRSGAGSTCHWHQWHLLARKKASIHVLNAFPM